MKILRNAMIICLSAIMLLTAGCANTRWVYEYNGEQIPAGAYINYMIYAITSLEEREYEAHSDEEEYTLPSLNQLLKMTTDGMLNSDWVKKESEIAAKEHFAIEQLYTELGLSLSSDEKAALESYADYALASNPDFYKDNGISRASILLFHTDEYKRDIIFETMYGEGGERYVSDDELRAIFKETYLKMDMMYILRNDVNEVGETISNTELAEEYRSRLQAGELMADLNYEYSLSRAETEEEKEEITRGENEDGISITGFDPSTLSSNPAVKAVADTPVGSAGVYEYDYYYMIFKRLDILEDPADFEEFKSEVLNKYKFDEFLEYLREIAEGISLTPNQSALNRYKPESINSNSLQ